jgi:hypothetical protein
MPTGKNWTYFIYVNLAFAIYIGGILYFSKVEEIKKNWSIHRCNPLYMPFAENPQSNFAYCVQNIQASYMGYLLQPLTYASSSMSDNLSNLTTEMNSTRGMFDKIRGFSATTTQMIYGVLLNMVIEFEKVTIGIKDVLNKTIGSLVSVVYILDGGVKTIKSASGMSPDERTVALGKCFAPFTEVKLANGNVVCMKDINLGDVLENNSEVISVMKIDNKKNPVPVYIIKGGVNNSDIYVTGSHMVLDKSQNKFINVENYNKAYKSKITPEWFSCLITSDHKIKIGSEIFWDWEDHFIKVKPK